MKQQSITNLPLSPDEERRRRMIKYSVAMGIRVLCIISILFVPGWWAVIPAIGAVFLPYFAVVIANVGADPRGADVQRPGNILPMMPPPPGAGGPAEARPDAGGVGDTDDTGQANGAGRTDDQGQADGADRTDDQGQADDRDDEQREQGT